MDKLQPGQMLGPYRIIEQIGEGGMATVYKAYQASMDRNVAIKVLPSQLADSAEFTQRFQQEARIIAKLEHPHILPVFDYGESDGITYFVMRYLDAGTLREKMEQGRPLALSDVDRLFTQLAEALSYAHSFGIIHRDLKPSNAMIDSQGNLFLTDFGIAKLLESASPRLTQTDAIMGTPAYISPEQAQASKVDQRSDIYSLGIILYEMVTGRVPFVAETPLAVILKHVSDPLPPPSTVKADIPDGIERVVLKALAKDPNDRYATVAEFLSAWKQALDEAKSSARRAPETVAVKYASANTPSTPAHERTVSIPQTESKSRGWVGWAAGCVVGLCLLLGIGGGAFFVYNRAADQTPPETPLLIQTEIPPATNAPQPTATSVPVMTETLMEDDFSDGSNWGTGTDAESSVEYVDETLEFFVSKDLYYVWSTPNDTFYEDAHFEVTAVNYSSDSTSAFGIICNMQENNTSYYFAVTGAGEYAIGRYTLEDDILLTNDGQWETSDVIPTGADSYRIGVDCAQNTLTLYVDGQQVDSVSDDTFTSGYVALFAWSGEETDSTYVTFDDFVITSIK
jgi:serine/threonine protein kinase